MDLDRPDRFHYVLLRPHWESWLVKGGYSITLFGAMITAWLAGLYFEIYLLEQIGFWLGTASGIMVAIYTAFLFAQAKGRDFWQSPSMVFHMLIHSVMAGAAALILSSLIIDIPLEWIKLATQVLLLSIVANLIVMTIEISITHPTQDAKTVVKMIVNGRYSSMFWLGVIILTNILPLLLLTMNIDLISIAAILAIAGIYITEKIWVEAPQRIPLT
jgi:formate-dependent nitrite reductase membrane component NrfD